MTRAVIKRIGGQTGYPNHLARDPRRCTVEDRHIIRYRGPRNKIYVEYLYEELLDRVVEDMRNRVDDEYDNLVVIDGDEGVGKSNLAYIICKRIDPDFDLETGYIYNLEEFLERLDQDKRRGRVFLFDEATNVANNRQWMESGNTAFTKILEMIRSRGHTIIMCIPHYGRLDKYVREWRVKFRLTACERTWDIRRERLRGYFELQIPHRRKVIDKGTGEERLVVNFKSYGFGRFPKVPKSVWDEYNRTKDAHFDENIVRELDHIQGKRSNEEYKRDKAAIGELALTLYEMGLGYQEIADRAGMPYQTLKGRVWAAKKKRDSE